MTTERPVALMGAQFAVIHMIDRDQRIDAGVAGRLELPELQLALVVGQGPQRVAHQPDRGQAEVDEFDARDRVEQAEGGFHHARDAGMAMESDPHLHGLRSSGSRSSTRLPRNRMNGVISNGLLPVRAHRPAASPR